jgi:alcohol dehydrogenase
MANANAGVIHALGYPLTLRYAVPHGIANALMATAALERTWPARPDRYAELAALLAGEATPGDRADPGNRGAAAAAELPAILSLLLGRIEFVGTLQAWGVEQAELPRLAREAAQFRPILDNTPVALGEEDLLALYRAAWRAGAGAAPASPGAGLAAHALRRGPG